MFHLKNICIAFFDIAYVFAPIFGFLPQIYSNKINYNPFLSLLTIFSNVLKLFPTSEKMSEVLLYQFTFAILVHCYLIKTSLSQGKNTNSTFFDVLPNFRKAYRYFLFAIFSFISVVGVLDSMKYTHLFMKAAVIIETVISLLHIKLLERKSSLKLLSTVLLMGDLIKTGLFIVKFSAPIELILATLIQLGVNIYLTVR